ncbi:MAG: RHS repeat domain-containing protein [Rhizomicrobium sp.]
MGQVTEDSRVVGSNTYTVAYSYDPAGNVLTATYPSGRIVTYTRDGQGRIAGIATRETAVAAAVTVASGASYSRSGRWRG